MRQLLNKRALLKQWVKIAYAQPHASTKQIEKNR